MEATDGLGLLQDFHDPLLFAQGWEGKNKVRKVITIDARNANYYFVSLKSKMCQCCCEESKVNKR